jgi:adiponectin receptor
MTFGWRSVADGGGSSSSSSLLREAHEHGANDKHPGCEDTACKYFAVKVPIVQLYPDLGTWEDVPEYQRRPFIKGGYRLNTEGCIPCLQSAAYLHNETVNIWSHALGLLAVAAWLWRVMDHEGNIGGRGLDNVLVIAVTVVTMNCLFWSAFYHSRHCDVESVCFNCFYADIGGVVVLLGGSLAVGVKLAFRCHPVASALYLVLVAMKLGAMIAVVARPDATDSMRAKVFTSCGLLGLIPAVHFLVVASPPTFDLMITRLLGVLFFYVGGAVIYVLRFPEKLWPGRFDYIGQSHNIWHFGVVAGMITWLDAMQRMAVLNASTTC